jgi:hypothetical protein
MTRKVPYTIFVLWPWAIVHVNKGDSMGVTMMWDNEDKTVFRLSFESPWTWDEQQAAIAQAKPLVESVSLIVDIICDLSNGPQFPLGYPMKYLRHAAEMFPNNAGITIIVGASVPVQSLLQATMQVFANVKYRTFFAPSIEAAYTIIAERKNNTRGQSR